MATSVLTYPRLDYTDRDFFGLRSRAFKEIRSIYPEWSDEAVANFGNLLVELGCALTDTVHYYQDNQSGESRLTTAQQLSNARAHSRLTGYQPRGQTASIAYLTYTLAAPAVGDVVIPIYTQISTKEITAPVVFQTQEEVVILAGNTSAIGVLAEHSIAQTYAATSTGVPNQVIVLPAAPFLGGSLAIEASNGAYALAPYETNFLDVGPTDRVYTVDLDAQDRAVVRFGDGQAGEIPEGLIEIAYKTGGGRAGRVDAGKLTQLPAPFYDSLGNAVLLSVTNPEASSPAEDAEGVEAIRLKAPQVVRVQRRAVAREDFEISAEQVPGVVRALYVTRNELESIEENRGKLYVVPSGLGTAPQSLLDQVAARFAPGGETPSHVTHRVDVYSAIYLPVAGLARVTLARWAVMNVASKAAVVAAARAAWAAWFAPEITLATGEVVTNMALDFGYYFQRSDGTPTGSIAWSDLFNVVRDVDGITRIDPGTSGFALNGERKDVAISPVAWPIDGGLTLIDADTGQVL